MTVGINFRKKSLLKAFEEPRKLAKMVSNTQRIDVIRRSLRKLDTLEERVKNLTSAR